MDIASAPPAGATKARTFRAMDWGGWAMLIVLAAIFLGTGITIRLALRAQHPLLGDVVVLGAGIVALTWAALYYSLRVSAHVVTDEEGFALVHGPWRHVIAWRDVARMSEWTTLTEGIRYGWLALWSAQGGRLQVREDLVRHFGELRAAILTHLDEPQETPPIVAELAQPLVMTSDPRRPITFWGSVGATGIIGGALLALFLPDIAAIGVTFVALGIVALGAMVGAFVLRQRITVSRSGIVSQRGPLRKALTWEGMYALERGSGNGLRGAADILGRGLVLLLFRVDRRCVILPGEVRSHSTITVRANSGERIRIREDRYHHPEWLRARLRAEVAALRAAEVPLAAQVQPLPKTGPLAPGTELPPDPLEASTSTLWMRESIGLDPFTQTPPATRGVERARE